MLISLAIDLYKISKFKYAFEDPFCAEESGFNFDQLKNQAEQAFKKVETKPELHLYLSQFFNLQEDINDCFNLAKQIAC
jgi:hypothetical protein